MSHPVDITKKQRECPHPLDRQENKLTRAGLALQQCGECGKVVWMEDPFTETTN